MSRKRIPKILTKNRIVSEGTLLDILARLDNLESRIDSLITTHRHERNTKLPKGQKHSST